LETVYANKKLSLSNAKNFLSSALTTPTESFVGLIDNFAENKSDKELAKIIKDSSLGTQKQKVTVDFRETPIETKSADV